VLGETGGSTDVADSFLLATLHRGPLGLIEVAREASLPPDTNLLIIVDQFEELFRFTQNREIKMADEAQAFVKLLIEASAQRKLPIYIVLTMRSEFLRQCAALPKLPEAINDGLFLVPRMTRNQLRDAIEGPIDVYQGTISAALVNRLLNDLGTEADQLPLIQHVLMRMWLRVSDRAKSLNARTHHAIAMHDTGKEPVGVAITMDDYDDIGTLANALSNHAEEAFAELKGDQPRIAKVLFRCLSESRIGEGDIRRPVLLGAVAKVADVPPGEFGGELPPP
jgi:hypothetical protein